MAKVKRKQIEYEGTDKQVIKGNGELGDYSDDFIVELTTTEYNISSIEGELSCNRIVDEILEAVQNNKNIKWYLHTTGSGTYKSTTHELYQGRYSYREQTKGNRSMFTVFFALQLIDIDGNGCLIVQVDVRKIDIDGVISESIEVGSYYQANLIPTVSQSDWNQNDSTKLDYIKNKPTIPTLRTINNEQITDSDLGNINLYDGFYFPNAVKDFDGNWYNAVVIGTQVWLTENLRSLHFANGSDLPNMASVYAPKYPNNDPALVKEYGILYHWMPLLGTSNSSHSEDYTPIKSISPNGFHIPSDKEFNTLISYLSKQKRFTSNVEHNDYIAKSLASTTGWENSEVEDSIGLNTQNNNKLLFNAKPAGCYISDFEGFGETAVFLTSRYKPYNSVGRVIKKLNTNSPTFDTQYRFNQGWVSIRCISDLNPVQFRNWYIQQYGSLQHHLPEEVQVQSDWNQTDTTAPDFIKNKPTIEKYIFEIQGDGTISSSSTDFTFNKTAKEVMSLLSANKPILWRFVESGGLIWTLKEIDRNKTANGNRSRCNIRLEGVDFTHDLRYSISLVINYNSDTDDGSIQMNMSRDLPVIPTMPTPVFYGYTNTVESTPTKVVTLAEPTTGFKNGTYIMVYFQGGGVPAGNNNAISIGNDVYYLAYKAQGITQAGIINQGDKVLLWCHNGFAHVISNDRWSLPIITAADEGKILKVVNGALTLVNP